MVALADVFRRFAEAYLAAHGASVLPSHRRAIADIRKRCSQGIFPAVAREGMMRPHEHASFQP